MNDKLIIKIVKGTIYIGVFTGTYVTEYFTIKALVRANVNPIVKLLGGYFAYVWTVKFTRLWFLYGRKLIDVVFDVIEIKREDKRELRRKAEANGWTIVECEYTIEQFTEAA